MAVSAKWRLAAITGAAAVAVACAGTAASAGMAASAGTVAAGAAVKALAGAADGAWGTAQEAPGTATLNAGGHAGIDSVSCASAGDCSAGGSYKDGSGNSQAFVIDESNGVWGTAQEAPGTATLNAGGNAGITSVSCASAGNCSAGGTYTDGSGQTQVFVVSEVNGSWGNAEEMPGSTALNGYGFAEVTSISCGSAGNCAAGGFVTATALHTQAFVAVEVSGTWGNAEVVPGSAALNAGNFAETRSVSCASAGNCSAGGWYTDSSINQQAFVVDEVSGSWGNAQELPGTATLNSGGFAELDSVSCPSAGNCSAGGTYADSSGTQAFVASQANGTWGNAAEVPGLGTLNTGSNTQGAADVASVSCASAGNCSAGGWYTESGSYDEQAFVVSQVSATWGNAEEVPGTSSLNAGGKGRIDSVSCASAGDCSALGHYQDGSGGTQAFAVGETGGNWGTAAEMPGTAALNAGGSAGFYQGLSCAAAGACSVGGWYTDGSGNQQAFVAGEKPVNGSAYQPVSPVRVLDTRNGTGGYSSPVGPGQSISVQVTGSNGVPADATAVVLNVTAVSGTAASYVTVYPAGQSPPTASNLNFTAGETIPNLVVVPVGSGGAVDFYNHSGNVNLLADLAGYYAPSGGSVFSSLAPVRVLDTRNGTGGYSSPVGPGASISLPVTGSNGVPAGATAVVLNVTAVAGTASSFVTVYPDAQSRPVASNLNFTAGQTIPNLVVVPVGGDGKVDFYNHSGNVNLVADLAGYYAPSGGSVFSSLAPVRVLDTRDGTGGYSSPVGPGQSISVQVTGSNGVPADATAVVLNVTAVSGTAASYVTVYPAGQSPPTASNLNFTAGETIPNLVVVPVGSGGAVDFYNHSGNVNLVADLAGYYLPGS